MNLIELANDIIKSSNRDEIHKKIAKFKENIPSEYRQSTGKNYKYRNSIRDNK